MFEDTTSGLATLPPSGAPPRSRITSASEAKHITDSLRDNDQTRSRKRALLKGLVDGYPPFKATELRKAGRAGATNVNWRVAEAYLGSALGAFYDLFHEAETYASIILDDALGPEAGEWGKIVTEEFDRLQKEDRSFDYVMQISQYETVLFGVGPVFFRDAYDWRCRASSCKDVLVPERAKSDTALWELCVVLEDYLPHDLYSYITNPKSATEAGWNVEATRKAIVAATPDNEKGGRSQNWEWHEQELKNNSYAYSLRSKTVNVSHLLFREFPVNGDSGRISHKIVLDDSGNDGNQPDQFIYEKVGRYASWDEITHPMYYDHGGGGEHHSVIGMGMKMYSAMEIQNRLLCKLTDDAFAPRVLFKPTTAGDNQKLSIANYGHYGVLPHNLNVEQTTIQPFIQESLQLNRELSQVLSANLSLYRQFQGDKSGNPITATEAQYKAGEQSRLSATQLNRYYVQLDALYAERYRRVVNSKLTSSWPGGAEAQGFIEACVRRGVPEKALRKTRAVTATRVVGQGSPFMRQQSLEFLMNILPALPEGGREGLLRDIIASRAGQRGADRYYPKSQASKLPSDQEAEAMDKVAGMKVGLMPLVTDSQNPAIYAQTFIKAAMDALASVQQGGDPAEVLRFVELAGTAASAHLQRLTGDPSRQQLVKQLQEQLKALGEASQQLQEQMAQQQEQQAEQQQAVQQAQAIDQGIDPKTRIKAAQASHDMRLKEETMRHDLDLKRRKVDQDLILKDAIAASQISKQGKQKS